MKTYLITGVTGQAGSYLADILLESGSIRVVGVVRRSSHDNTERIKHNLGNPNFTFVECDITDYTSVSNIISEYKPDFLFNTAAQSHVGTSFDEPTHTLKATGESVLNLLECIRKISPTTRFLQFSSSEMFGSNYSTRNYDYYLGMDKDDMFQDEHTRMSPNSPYGIAKLAGYHYTRLYREAYGLFAANAIFFNMESPRRGGQFVTKKITNWLQGFDDFRGNDEIKELHGDEIGLKNSFGSYPKLRLGNLEAKRDWGFCKDYMEGAISIINHNEPDDFVLCTGQTFTIADFLTEAFRNIGIEDWSPYVVIDQKFIRPREVEYLRGDASKIERILKWKPKTDFKELVRMMMNLDC